MKSKSYAAIYPNGNFVAKETLEELIILEIPSFFLEISFSHDYKTSFNNTYEYYAYKIINSKEKPATFKVGNFEIVDIGKEKGDWLAYGIPFKIRDLKTNEIFDFQTKNNGLSVFKNEIFPLLEKLNKLGSHESFINYQKTLEQKKRIKKLEEDLDQLKTKNEELETKNANLKSEITKYQKLEEELKQLFEKHQNQ